LQFEKFTEIEGPERRARFEPLRKVFVTVRRKAHAG
jgi:hypothetical protein